ncbi:unnamed protein product [Dracunculus medinensis]|uniref:Large ribosomal subunit protein mL49 n=1 Tax=Dracunculus medinensis TaxID=318479 RepID=A0A3P7TEC0_DRAME|nr:unnamed protein product [Dracunculus medinensis]
MAFDFVESHVDWKYVERLLSHKIIPDIPLHSKYPTASGWRPPKPATGLPYYIARLRNHMLPLFLETRRDNLNFQTMDYEAVDLVVVKRIHGDVFACEQDLKKWLEKQIKHPVATNVDELKGVIKIKGADRSLVEKCLYEFGF